MGVTEKCPTCSGEWGGGGVRTLVACDWKCPGLWCPHTMWLGGGVVDKLCWWGERSVGKVGVPTWLCGTARKSPGSSRPSSSARTRPLKDTIKNTLGLPQKKERSRGGRGRDGEREGGRETGEIRQEERERTVRGERGERRERERVRERERGQRKIHVSECTSSLK